MSCYTMVAVNLEDNAVNRKAREKLGLPLEGSLSQSDAGRVKVEAGIIRSRATLMRLAPNAVIRRDGNKLTVTVSV